MTDLRSATGAPADGRTSAAPPLPGLPERRRGPAFALGAVVGAAAAFGLGWWLSDGDGNSDPAAETAELVTVAVERRDLVDDVEWSATLGYGEEITASAATDVTITGAAERGGVLERGDAIAEVDGAPVVVFYGQVPPWRDLAEGDDGSDVRQLEENLVALGYDPDDTVSIDAEFTSETAAMVERWQAQLGVDETGTVAAGSYVVVPGEAAVVVAPSPGDAVVAGSALATVSPRVRTHLVVTAGEGTVTNVVQPGIEIEQGTALYELDNIPVLALTDPDLIAGVILDPDMDLEDLEAALVFLGHDPDRAITIDGVYDLADSAAIANWQTSIDLPTTGSPDPVHYTLVPIGLTADPMPVATDTELGRGRPVVNLEGSELIVTVTVPVADADAFVEGQELTVEMADESVTDGVVTEVSTVAVPSVEPDGDPTIDVTIVLASSTSEPMAGPVTVVAAGDRVDGATVVPTRALVTLREGGTAVEKVLDDGTTLLVAIEIGNFDEGYVEIVDSPLAVGDQVVVPA